MNFFECFVNRKITLKKNGQNLRWYTIAIVIGTNGIINKQFKQTVTRTPLMTTIEAFKYNFDMIFLYISIF